MVLLNAETGVLTFKKDIHSKHTLFKRLDSGIAEKDIPLEEIKSIEKFRRHAQTLMIQLRYVACSVQSGSVLLLDAENEEERDSWVEEIEKLVLTNATGGLNLVREEISESIHKYYDFKLKTNEGVLVRAFSPSFTLLLNVNLVRFVGLWDDRRGAADCAQEGPEILRDEDGELERAQLLPAQVAAV